MYKLSTPVPKRHIPYSYTYMYEIELSKDEK